MRKQTAEKCSNTLLKGRNSEKWSSNSPYDESVPYYDSTDFSKASKKIDKQMVKLEAFR